MQPSRPIGSGGCRATGIGSAAGVVPGRWTAAACYCAAAAVLSGQATAAVRLRQTSGWWIPCCVAFVALGAHLALFGCVTAVQQAGAGSPTRRVPSLTDAQILEQQQTGSLAAIIRSVHINVCQSLCCTGTCGAAGSAQGWRPQGADFHTDDTDVRHPRGVLEPARAHIRAP